MTHDPNNPMKIPFINLKLPSIGPNAYAVVSGYLSKARQFLQVQGKYDNFVNGVKLEGLFEISDDNGGQVLFEGSSTFGFESMEVSGLINKNQQIFTGSIEESVGGSVKIFGKKKKWRIRGNIDVTIAFQNGNPSFGFDAKMQACAFGKCDSVRADVSIEDDGRLKVCAKVPVVGRKCDKI